MKNFIVVSLLAFAFSGCSVYSNTSAYSNMPTNKQIKQCEAGNASVCFEIARQYEKVADTTRLAEQQNISKEQLYNKAKEFYTKGCEFKSANACYNSGKLNERIIGYNYNEYAINDYQKACDLGNTSGCEKLADAYKWGRGAVKQDLRKAQEYYKKSNSGDIALTSYFEELPSYEKSCKLNDINACLKAVEIYSKSTFIEGYENNAKSWCEKAAVLLEQECKQGNNKSCTDLIALYTKFNLPKATELLEQACNRGDSKSCADLITLYLEFNLPRATKLLEQACKRGDNEACFDVATLYYEKKEVQNLSKALAFFDTACKRGDNTACFNVAIFYNEGKGTQINLSKAKEYYHKACNTGIQKACEKLMAITNIGIQ